jgi:hypothetical protein
MKHRAAPAFWECYDKLPAHIRAVADKSFALLKNDSRHPSLHFKQVGTYWTARIGLRYRAIGVQEGEVMVWFWIGSHADYDELIR